jgi:hypothetical protein
MRPSVLTPGRVASMLKSRQSDVCSQKADRRSWTTHWKETPRSVA